MRLHVIPAADGMLSPAKCTPDTFCLIDIVELPQSIEKLVSYERSVYYYVDWKLRVYTTWFHCCICSMLPQWSWVSLQI